MIHPIKSIEAHYQTWATNHFQLTKHAKKLKSLNGIHTNETCFIIGNGPSLRPDDLSVLWNNGVKSFASNRIYNTYKETDWRPDFYVSEDEYVVDEIKDIINSLSCNWKFIPIHLKWYKNVKIHNAFYFLHTYYTEGDSKKFSDNIASDIVCRATVITTCAQIAIYMGFKKIYLIGVDHNFSRMVDRNGKILINNKIKDHYGVDKTADEKTKGIFNIDVVTDSFIDLKEFAKERGVEIYNATRGGKLEVFERVNFDDLFVKED